MEVEQLNIAYSIADQNFNQTKSLGILNYSTQLPFHLAARPEVKRLTVLTNRTLAIAANLPPKMEVRVHDQPIKGKLSRILWDQSGVYGAAKKSGNEWLFLPKGFASFVRQPPIKLAGCVADVMWDHYDKKYSGAFSRWEGFYFKRAFYATVRHAKIIFTISDFSTAEVKRVARQLGLTAPPVQTMGIGFLPARSPSPAKRQSILVLAGRFLHKRTGLAIDYLSRWQRETNYNGNVEWVGQFPSGLQFPEFPNWVQHPRLPEPEYRKIVGESRALIFFSDYEGFGMPPVEATLVGTCPVFSDLAVTREVMGKTGFSFLNSDYESFACALGHALKVTPAEISLWSKELLGKHNWDKVADRVVRGMLSIVKAESA